MPTGRQMARNFILLATASLAALSAAPVHAKDGAARKACAAEARLPTPRDPTGKTFDDMNGERAVERCERALAANPDDRDTIANLGRAYSKMREGAKALPLLERAATLGSVQAANSLAGMYEEGVTVPKDLARAFAYAKSGENSGNAWIVGRLGNYYLDGIGTTQDRAKGLALYEKALALGNAGAAWDLGEIYRFGKSGVPQDYTLARRAYERGAAMGQGDAAAALAYMTETGLAGPKNLVEARRLYARAIALGSGWAASNLSVMVAEGEGGAKDVAEAIRLMRVAADLGEPSGMRRLAFYYRNGIGLERDVPLAISWYRKAADDGDDDAMVELGKMASAGEGMPIDETAGRDWYRRAADAGNPQGMRLLARALSSSEFTGQPSDNPAAVRWFHKLAEDPEADNARIAADAFARGQEVPIDLKAARRYYERALAADIADVAPKLIEVVLRDAPGAADKAYALALIEKRAAAGEGWALAALAHPGPMIEQAGLKIDRAGWRAQIAATRDPKVLVAVAKALQDGKLARQQFGLAMQYTAAGADPVAAWEFQIKLMLELRLQEAALREMVRYSQSDAFKALSPERKQRFLNCIDHPYAFGFPRQPSHAPMLRALAELGVKEAASRYAWMLLDEGKGDAVAARTWFEKGAALGSGDALRAVGYLYMNGYGVEKSALKAVRAWEDAYRGGETYAAFNLAVYYAGEMAFSEAEMAGAPRPDPTQAFEWMQRAAPSSYALQVRLARMHLAGNGTKVDTKEGLRLLRLAVHCGDQSARVALGEAYLHGVGVAKDSAMALRWFRHAAASGYDGGAEAMVRASALGWGMKPDVREARRWLAEGVRRGGEDATTWSKACGSQASIACLSAQAGFTPVPIGAETPGLSPEPSYEARAASLTREVDAAVVQGSEFAVFEGFRALEEHQLLFGRMDDYLATKVRSLALKEAGLRARFGGQDNYFALIESSCLWSSAAKEADGGGRPEAALFFAKVAVNKLQDARKRIADLDPGIRECFVKVHQDRYRYLADIFLGLGRFGEAEHVLAMLKDFESYNYTRGKQGEAFERMPLDAKQSASLAAFDNATAALTLAGAARDRLIALQGKGELTPEQQKELEAATTALGAAQSAFRGDLASLGDAVAGLDAKQAPDLAAKANKVASIQPRLITTVRRLGKDVAALHAVVLPDRIHWLLTTANFQRSIVVPIDITALRKDVGAYRQSISDKAVFIADPASKLYRAAFEPVDKALRAAGVKQVMLSLDDALRYLPFAALHDGKDWLAARYAFSAFRSIDEVQTGPADGAGWRVAALGASQGGSGLSPLPAVPAELGGIVKDGAKGVLPGVMKLDAAFDRAALASSMAGGYRVIHIASHFALDPASADKSFLLLGDGKTLPLSEFIKDGRFTAIDVDLLALSACQTGVPAIDQNGAEVESSLAELAQKAGASAVLASLWSVADESTAVLMQRFYAIHAKGGVSKAEALRQAQLALMTSQGAAGGDRGVARVAPTASTGPAVTGYAHPFYWAPFMLLGNWQ